MAVILVGGEKGGTGKTTISTNLAVMAACMGRDCILVDTDKQANSNSFISGRNELGIKPTPPCVQITGKHLNIEIEDLARRYQDIIIDAGGHDSVELRSAMVAASVHTMITPVQPSSYDIETLLKIDELVNISRIYNQNLQAHILINRAPTHPQIKVSQDAEAFIKSDLQNVQVCPVRLYDRMVYQYSAGKRLSVVEFEAARLKEMPPYQASSYNAKATEEMSNLYEKIFNEPFDKTSLKV